jgi:uncharacterized protein YbaR (Trm112 family)
MTESGNEHTGFNTDLLEILACPLDHAPVRLDQDQLVCTRCGRRFPIENGTPNMLVDEDE